MSARYGFVLSVEAAEGRRLVVKSTPDPGGGFQAVAAQQLAVLGIGPAVHEVWESETGAWTVMDQIRPGTPSIRSPLPALVAVLRPLVAGRQSNAAFPPVSAWLRDRLHHGDELDLPTGRSVATREERDHALAILDELVTDERRTLCHGDMSSGNVLSGPAGLMLIDPRAVSGDVEYDAAVLALKAGHSVAELVRLLGADVERAEAWASIAIAARV
ncbi:phosphotransferase [Amycolatopsis antarctica]|nr:phosphotransferase [Amycolatopsis antarctica]